MFVCVHHVRFTHSRPDPSIPSRDSSLGYIYMSMSPEWITGALNMLCCWCTQHIKVEESIFLCECTRNAWANLIKCIKNCLFLLSVSECLWTLCIPDCWNSTSFVAINTYIYIYSTYEYSAWCKQRLTFNANQCCVNLYTELGANSHPSQTIGHIQQCV